MFQNTHCRVLTYEDISSYSGFLQDEEKSAMTIQKYIHDLNAAADYFNGGELTKSALLEWKKCLTEKFAATTVNTILAAINSFLSIWAGMTCL